MENIKTIKALNDGIDLLNEVFNDKDNQVISITFHIKTIKKVNDVNKEINGGLDGFECAPIIGDNNGGACVSKRTAEKIMNVMEDIEGSNNNKDIKEKFTIQKSNLHQNIANIIEHAMEVLDCKSQTELLNHPKIIEALGMNAVEKEKEEHFKPAGPFDSTKLIHNKNIYNVLKQYEKAYPDFYAIDYHMIDFDEDPNSELNKLDFVKQVSSGKTRFGVIFNTDVHTGGGKHWFAIFFDFRNITKDINEPSTINFFNSSGNHPVERLDVWLKNKMQELENKTGKSFVLKIISNKRVQYGSTECGIYSMYFIIWCIKHPDKDIKEFMNQDLSDERMFRKVRQWLFRPEND